MALLIDPRMSDLLVEVLPIPGWAGYHATTEGLVLGKQGEPLRPSRHWRTGHLRVRLYGGSTWRHAVDKRGNLHRSRHADLYVHVLVALAFHGPPPSPEHLVLHWDDVPDHNWPSNLRWGLRSENEADKRRNRSRDPDGFDWETGEFF